MQYKTFAQLKAKIERNMDTELEEFIQPEEFKEYVNDAIDFAQASIHKLGLEDMYYLTNAKVDLVQGQRDYELPSNIYMNKIKAIEYRSGSTIYTIDRLRGLNMFESREYILQFQSNLQYYKYLLRNDSASANIKLELIPPSHEDTVNALTIWYFREANHWTTSDAEFCDLPNIAVQYLECYVTSKIYEKEGHANHNESMMAMEATKKLMLETMEQMIPDEKSDIVADLSLYQDLS
jgi:hypothetical protein